MDLRVLTHKVELSHRSDPYRVYAIGDIHIGDAGCDYDEFLATIREIEEDDECMVFVMGDVIEAISRSDPRFEIDRVDSRFQDPKSLSNLPKAECDYAVKHLSRIKDKIGAFLTGNHEQKVAQKSEQQGLLFDPSEYMIEKLGVEEFYLGYEGGVTLEFRPEKDDKKGPDVLTFYLHHGSGGGSLPGSKINRMFKTLGFMSVDAHLMGHTHELLACRKGDLAIDGDAVVTNDRLAVNTGTYLKTYSGHSGYGARAGYPPTHIGCARLFCYPRKKMVRALI